MNEFTKSELITLAAGLASLAMEKNLYPRNQDELDKLLGEAAYLEKEAFEMKSDRNIAPELVFPLMHKVTAMVKES